MTEAAPCLIVLLLHILKTIANSLITFIFVFFCYRVAAVFYETEILRNLQEYPQILCIGRLFKPTYRTFGGRIKTSTKRHS